MHGLACSYDTNPNETHNSAFKRRNAELEQRARDQQEVYSLLRQVAEEEAANVLRRIRAGENNDTILVSYREGMSQSSAGVRQTTQAQGARTQTDGQTLKAISFDTKDTITTSTQAEPRVLGAHLRTDFEDSSSLVSGNEGSLALPDRYSHLQVSQTKPSGSLESEASRRSLEMSAPWTVRPSNYTTAGPLLPNIASILDPEISLWESESIFARLKLPNAEDFDQAFSTFIRCTGKLFPVFTQDQKRNMASQIAAREFDLLSKSALCLLCSACAVSAQYCNNEYIREKGEKYYDIARHCFDACVAADSMGAMKACTMLAMYNVNRKASIALTYVGKYKR